MKRRTGGRPEVCQALVTGGAGGIGAAISRHLAADGMHVIVHAAHNPAAADKLVAEIHAAGGAARPVQFDLADADQTAGVMAELTAGSPLAVVVHNAGIHDDAPMAGMTPHQWQQVMDVNLNGFFRVVQPALLGMARLRWGRVIAVSSVAARLGNRGQTNYAASKAGLHGAAKSLARELGSRGVTVNVVAPGVIETEMSRGTFDEAAVRNIVPMERMGKPEEVAALVAFLVSEEAGYISGQVIGVDGAMT
ncbi:MAG: 3-oxoacyl-ACP reductase FabG [Wenzhouxiangellaceae bacterium]